MRPALFLDRDGTIIVDRHYLSDPAQVELLPGVAEAVRLAREAGFAVVVVSNQSGVARGLHQESDVRAVNRRMEELLAAEGAVLDLISYCPHHPLVGEDPAYRRLCQCRKPRPGQLLRAAWRLDLDLQRSAMIGDQLVDLHAGAAAGVPAYLVSHDGSLPAGCHDPVSWTTRRAVLHVLETVA
jgi:D-glycero-D-manno-heptose 1,7-bisphosphate phosphatase